MNIYTLSLCQNTHTHIHWHLPITLLFVMHLCVYGRGRDLDWCIGQCLSQCDYDKDNLFLVNVKKCKLTDGPNGLNNTHSKKNCLIVLLTIHVQVFVTQPCCSFIAFIGMNQEASFTAWIFWTGNVVLLNEIKWKFVSAILMYSTLKRHWCLRRCSI